MGIVGKDVYYDANKVLNAPVGNAIPIAKTLDLSGASISEVIDVEVAASANTDADPIVAFDAILNSLIKVQLDALMAAVSPGYGLDLTNTVDYQAKVVSVKRNKTAPSVTDIYLIEASVSFIIKIELLIEIT